MSVNKNDLSSFPLGMIIKAMAECKTIKISENKAAKKQALEIIKELEKIIPIKRAQMRICIKFDNLKQLVDLKE